MEVGYEDVEIYLAEIRSIRRLNQLWCFGVKLGLWQMDMKRLGS
jgi:hypothetical protein